MSEEIVVQNNVHSAISRVMSKVGYVQKERNPNLKFSYASESALIAALRPEMVVEKLTICCVGIDDIKTTEYQSANGSRMINVSLTARWQITHAPSETFITVTSRGEGADTSDKANNKAMTGSFKYALRQTFMIETGNDPDSHQEEDKESETAAPRAWSAVVMAEVLAMKAFENVYEANNALKLSKVLKPGITGANGVKYWITKYKEARLEGKLEPAQSAEFADDEYLAEKARKAQDKVGEQ